MVDVTNISFGDSTASSLVMSMGFLGHNLQTFNIVTGIPTLSEKLGSSHNHWLACATAICTTDTFPKLVSKQFNIGGHTYTLAGLAKAGPLIAYDESSPAYKTLRDESTGFAQQLAPLVVRDGKGTTKFIRIDVNNAQSYEDAKTVASSIANSAFFKTAMFGHDANWGHILCAIGYVEVGAGAMNTAKISVSFVPADGSIKLSFLVNGEPEKVDEERASEILKQKDLQIKIGLGTGGG